MVEGLANVEGLTNGGRAYQWWKDLPMVEGLTNGGRLLFTLRVVLINMLHRKL